MSNRAIADRLTLSVSKRAIASRLNITPEYFSRVLHALSARQLIRVEGRAIDMLVGRLRQKTDPALIRTERGLGYVLSAEVARDAD